MATAALVDIEKIVTNFLLKYKKTTEDYISYLEHACDCLQHFNLYDGNEVVTVKVTVNANKWIDMPVDMVGFNDLLVLQTTGRFWSCTEQSDIITTTTFTGLVEGRDSTIGEGADIDIPELDTYGAVGAVNDYNYNIVWSERRIYVLGITTETVALQYVSTGIEITGVTYVPALVIPMIDAYLLWKDCVITGNTRMEPLREKQYDKTELEIRNFINSMSYETWHDLLLGLTTQAPLR